MVISKDTYKNWTKNLNARALNLPSWIQVHSILKLITKKKIHKNKPKNLNESLYNLNSLNFIPQLKQLMWYVDGTLYFATYNLKQDFYCYSKLKWILHSLFLLHYTTNLSNVLIFANLKNKYINVICKFICFFTTSGVKWHFYQFISSLHGSLQKLEKMWSSHLVYRSIDCKGVGGEVDEWLKDKLTIFS